MNAPPLKLFAFDPDDLAVVSAHLQDAVLTADHIAFLARERRFVLLCERPDRSAEAEAGRRLGTGLRIERVTAVKARGIPKGEARPLSLIALTFVPGEAPGGTIELIFAGGAGLRLSVECIEAAMDDLAWSLATTENA